MITLEFISRPIVRLLRKGILKAQAAAVQATILPKQAAKMMTNMATTAFPELIDAICGEAPDSQREHN